MSYSGKIIIINQTGETIYKMGASHVSGNFNNKFVGPPEFYQGSETGPFKIESVESNLSKDAWTIVFKFGDNRSVVGSMHCKWTKKDNGGIGYITLSHNSFQLDKPKSKSCSKDYQITE